MKHANPVSCRDWISVEAKAKKQANGENWFLNFVSPSLLYASSPVSASYHRRIWKEGNASEFPENLEFSSYFCNNSDIVFLNFIVH